MRKRKDERVHEMMIISYESITVSKVSLKYQRQQKKEGESITLLD
jgi:hypothetical protein